MKPNYLNDEIKSVIELQVAEFYRYLTFEECVKAVNLRYVHFSQIGYAVSCLIKKASENK